MTRNGYEHSRAVVPRTATGALDLAAIDARARQLRRETVRALLGSLKPQTRHPWRSALASIQSVARSVVCTWAKVVNRLAAKPLPGECTRC